MLLESAIVSSLKAIDPSITYVLSGRNGVEPKQVFCLIEIPRITSSGMSYSNYASPVDVDTGFAEQKINQNKLLKLRLTYHGAATSNAGDRALYMETALNSFIGELAFSANGLSVLSKDDLKTIDIGYETNMFKRYILDLTLLTTYSESFNVDFINKAEVEGEVTIDELPVTFDIDVDVSNYQYNFLLAEDGTTNLTTEKNENIEIVTLGTG